jgi:hypothetical protein
MELPSNQFFCHCLVKTHFADEYTQNETGTKASSSHLQLEYFPKRVKMCVFSCACSPSRFKLLKWWAQSFLPGVPRIVAGFRDHDGVVVSVETYHISKISQLIKVRFQFYFLLKKNIHIFNRSSTRNPIGLCNIGCLFCEFKNNVRACLS